MKQMRRIFAVLLTLAMVLTMSMTAFADGTASTPPSANDTATITVTGIEDGATVMAYRIVEPL